MPLSLEDRVKYKALYLQTAKPYVKQLQDSLALFAQGQMSDESVQVAHRSAHSLTSQSVMMEYTHLGEVAGFFEKTFKAVVDKKLILQPNQIIVLQKVVNRMAASLEAMEKENTELDLSTELGELHAAIT